MCHSQWSSPMLPSAAPMPPWAATVCERVGKTLVSTATRSPPMESSSAARSPEPPAPTMTASNLRTGSVIASSTPQDGSRPEQVEQERERHRGLQREPQTRGAHVVHEDVAHADPGVVQERGEEKHRDKAEKASGKKCFQVVIGGRG